MKKNYAKPFERNTYQFFHFGNCKPTTQASEAKDEKKRKITWKISNGQL